MTDYRNPISEAAYRALLADLAHFPVRFTYADRPHIGFGGLEMLSQTVTETSVREDTLTVFVLDEAVQLRLLTSFYPSHGAYEWTVWFENTGSTDSALLREVYDCDMVFPGADPVLRGILGDHDNLYRPYETALSSDGVDFRSDFGRPTHIYFPYFDLVHGDGGTLLAIGWGGTWQAAFTPEQSGVRYQARSTNDLCTYLKPGESVRTSLVVLLPYRGREEHRAVNLWRDWFIRCSMPRANGKGESMQPFSTTCICNDTGLPNSDGSISERWYTWKPSLLKMAEQGIFPDFRWFDAGWYTDPNGDTVPADWWGTVGSWQLDPHKWPGSSFRESTDWARDHGMKTLVWFEPERVTHVEGLAKHYGYDPKWGLQVGNVITNNIGDPDCLAWTTERILRFLRDNRVEMYREDNNSDSAASWRLGDRLEGENRCGITENKAVVGHYAMWDAIIAFEREHDGCTFVDSCASGGGRNDLESMRRGVPLLRSDNDRTSTSLRLSMTTAFNRWIPFCGASTNEQPEQLSAKGVRDVYVWRASYLPVLNASCQWTQDPDTDFDMLRFGFTEWDTVKPYLLKDFYPLTPWHPEEERTGWTVYAYHDPETEKGVLLAFRMEECEDTSVTVALPFAKPGTVLRDADSGEVFTVTEGSFTVTRDQPRSAALYYIEKE